MRGLVYLFNEASGFYVIFFNMFPITSEGDSEIFWETPSPPPVAMPPALLNFFLMKKRDQRRKCQLVWSYPDLLSQFFAARHILHSILLFRANEPMCIYLQFQTCKFPAVFIALYKFIVECTSDVYFVHTYFHCMASVCPQQQPECY